jgi:hypothetical protein
MRAVTLVLCATALTGCVTINVYPGASGPVGTAPLLRESAGRESPGRATESALGVVLPPPRHPQRPIDTSWGRPNGAPACIEDGCAAQDDGTQRPLCVPSPRTIHGEL